MSNLPLIVKAPYTNDEVNDLFAIFFNLAGWIIDFAGTSPPAGFLECPTAAGGAQLVSRTTYAALFAAIGTTWGVGDGSTTFGIPWFPADYAAVQQGAGGVGTETAGEVISHTHGLNYAMGTWYSGVGYSSAAPFGNSANAVSVQATGGANNLPAGVRVLKCVKY